MTAARPMPQAKEAERMLLSQALAKPELLPDMLEIVHAADFYRPDHGALYQALQVLSEEDRPVDQLTVFDELERIDVNPEKAGGVGYILELFGAAPSTANWRSYAERVRDTSRRRQTVAAMDAARDRVMDPARGVDEVVDDAVGTLTGLVRYSQRSDDGTLDDAILELQIEAEDREERGAACLKTGFRALDSIMAVFPGDLWVHMAHTSHGKTALALEIVANLITGQDRVPTALISLEMKRPRLARRMISSWCQVEGFRERMGRLSEGERETWAVGERHFQGLPLRINHRAGMTINDAAAWLHRVDRDFKAQGHADGLGFAVIDYLQRLGQADPRQTRIEAVTHMSNEAKNLATRLNIPVLVLAQPNRVAMALTDKRPQLHHLRESGAIEQDADVVTAGYYHAKTVPDSEVEKYRTHYEVDVLKNRDGTTGRALLHFTPEITKFRDLTSSEEQNRTSPGS
jgi:replicative DNA helicase